MAENTPTKTPTAPAPGADTSDRGSPGSDASVSSQSKPKSSKKKKKAPPPQAAAEPPPSSTPSRPAGDMPTAVEVTVDARHEVVWMRFDALRVSELKRLISSTFAVPSDTEFTFKYKGAS